MKKLVAFLFAVFCCGIAHEARAEIASFSFSNNFGYRSNSSQKGYGQVEVTKNSDGYLHVTVNADGDYFSSPNDKGLTWDKFFFNVADGITLDPATIVVDETIGNWRVAQGNISLFGDFDYGIVGTALGNASISTLHFHIADPDLTLADIVAPNEDGWAFAGHLRGFKQMKDVYGSTTASSYLGAATITQPTPLPATFWLFGSALGGLALLMRRLGGRSREPVS